MAGGEARAFSAHVTAVSAIQWAPDGSRIYFLADEAKTIEERARGRKKDDVFQYDEQFKQRQLWSIAIATGNETRVTTARFVGDVVPGRAGRHPSCLRARADAPPRRRRARRGLDDAGRRITGGRAHVQRRGRGGRCGVAGRQHDSLPRRRERDVRVVLPVRRLHRARRRWRRAASSRRSSRYEVQSASWADPRRCSWWPTWVSTPRSSRSISGVPTTPSTSPTASTPSTAGRTGPRPAGTFSYCRKPRAPARSGR